MSVTGGLVVPARVVSTAEDANEAWRRASGGYEVNVVKNLKRASAHLNPRFLWVQTQSGDGLMLPDPLSCLEVLPSGSPDEAWGKAAIDCLGKSRWIERAQEPGFFDIVGRAMPDHERTVSMLLERFSCKSRRAMFKDMKEVSIEEADGVIWLRPMLHLKLEAWGRDRGHGLEDVSVPATDANELVGAALRAAFDRASA